MNFSFPVQIKFYIFSIFFEKNNFRQIDHFPGSTACVIYLEAQDKIIC